MLVFEEREAKMAFLNGLALAFIGKYHDEKMWPTHFSILTRKRKRE